MSENRMIEVAKMLDVELGEEFQLRCADTGYMMQGYLCQITECQCYVKNDNTKSWFIDSDTLMYLLNGEYEVVRLPYEPKHLEEYYTYENYNWDVVVDFWEGTMGDYALQIACCVFRTKEEAEKARPEIYKRLTGKDWAKRGDEDA